MVYTEFIDDWNNGSPLMLVHTSGSTGKPKPLWVEKARMMASARITCDYLGLKPGDTALLCLPLDYIAGKMMAVRGLVRSLQMICVEPSSHPLRSLSQAPVFAAMVPMQVIESMKSENELALLKDIRHLIIGGGAIDAELAEQLKLFPNAVWSTYGMTETLSHIALRRLSGNGTSLWYEPFSGVGVSVSADGCLVIDAPTVCAKTLHTNDMAEIAADGRRFRILGRKDNVVCSGGVKIQIEEVERMLAPYIHCPFAITKRPHAVLGEALVMLLDGDHTYKDAVMELCRNVLPKFWVPKGIVIGHIPMTKTGKPARKDIMAVVAGDD